MYRLATSPADRAEFDRQVENWGARCYQATVEFIDPPRVLTEQMLRRYLEEFMKHVEVDDEDHPILRSKHIDLYS